MICYMHTVYETRRQRLGQLIDKYGSIAALNDALGFPRTDSRLSRIRNANARTDRGGKVFQMGDAIAREIETTLSLPTGWMDTPPDLFAEWIDPQLRDALGVAMRAMDSDTQYRVVRMVEAMAAAVPPSPAPTPSAPHPMDETTYLDVPGATVTSSRIVIGEHTFATRNVGSVRVQEVDKPKWPIYIGLIGGAMLISSISGGFSASGVMGFVMVAAAAAVLFSPKKLMLKL